MQGQELYELMERMGTLTDEEISLYLSHLIPKDEYRRVTRDNYYALAEIMPDCLGFVATYYHLSKVIPEYYTVYDFGCAYNAQSYFFQKHKKYVAIEPYPRDREHPFSPLFCPSNCEIHRCTTGEFLKDSAHLVEGPSFAICNFVPAWYEEDSSELVRRHFKNCYTFYPDPDPRDENKMNLIWK
jgi:hypothetical protein